MTTIKNWMKCVGVPLLTAWGVYFLLCFYISSNTAVPFPSVLRQYAVPFALWLTVLAGGLTALWAAAKRAESEKKTGFWHKLLQKLAIRAAKRLLRLAALNLHILQDDAYLYPLDVREKTLIRLCREYEYITEDLAMLAEEPDLPEDITALYVMWSRIDHALLTEYEKYLPHDHWIRICGCSEAYKNREIMKKKLDEFDKQQTEEKRG